MELRVLNYFLTVAREENITKAAKLLHMTQPTLSRQIAQLEEELGVKLFTRSNHSIILTEDGMLLKRRAQELVALADKTKQDFIRKETALLGEIIIGSGEFQSSDFLSQLIATFRQKYPQVRYRIYSGDTDNIEDQIERGLLDLGLLAEPVDIRKYDFIPFPVKERWGVWIRSDSPLAEKGTLEPKDLVGIPLITASNDFAQSRLGKWFGEIYSQLEIAATGNLLYNEVMMSQRGIGPVLGIDLPYQFNDIRFIPLSPPLEMGTALIWKKGQIYSPATGAFLDFAKEYLKGISHNAN